MTRSKAKKMSNAAEVKKMAKAEGVPAWRKFKKPSKQGKNWKKQWEKQELSKEEANNQNAQGSSESPEGMEEPEQRAGRKRKASQDNGDRQDQSKKAKFHSRHESTDTPNSLKPASKPDKTQSGKKSTPKPSSHDIPSKAPQLPEGTFVNKRPLSHPAIASPYSGPDQQKIIYISPKSSFIASIKRVQKLLLHAERRFYDRFDAAKAKEGSKPKGGTLKSNEKAQVEEVILKGAGRAIESVVSIAVFLQKKPDYAIRLKVGAVSVVDDIEMRKNASGVGQKNKGNGKGSKQTNGSAEPDKDRTEDAGRATMDGQANGEESDEESAFETSATIQKGQIQAKASEDVPMEGSRVRDVSMLEVGITLKSILRYEQSKGRKTDPGYPHLK